MTDEEKQILVSKRIARRNIRIFLVAVIVLLFVYSAWYGAEMLIHGESQRSVVDLIIATLISVNVAKNIVKGVEKNEFAREFAREFGREFIKAGQKKAGDVDGKD